MMNEHSTPSSGRRTIVWFACLTVVTAAVAAVLIVTGRPKASAVTNPSDAFKTVALATGALSTSETVDGSVELSDVTEVLHRIAGQKSASASNGTSTPSTGASTGASTTRTTAAATNAFEPALAPSKVPPTSNPCASVPPSTPPTSSTVPTSSSVSSTTSPTTTTTTTTTGPGTTTTLSLPPGPTTTTPCDTTPPGGQGPTTTTAARGQGGQGSTSGASRAGGGAASTGSTARVTEVVTSVISTGADVQLGTILYAVQSKPVVAMAGPLPAWRTMQTGIADGPDVLQLELSLVALGYDRSNTMKVDNHFDANTKAAVERWQAGYGLAVTGSVTLGSVVFLRSETTVSAVHVKVGDSVGDGDHVLSLAAASQQVVIAVPTGDESFVIPGLALKVGNVDGTVTLLRSATQNGAAIVEAVITPTGAVQGATNGSTVKVTIQHQGLTDVLLAPAAALASRLDGSYALQVVGAGGATTWVTVTVLGVANGNVAVKGDGIGDGTKVLQPR